jgi:hypothetical protein
MPRCEPCPVIATPPFIVIASRRRGNPRKSKIKMQNDRAKMKKQSAVSAQLIATHHIKEVQAVFFTQHIGYNQAAEQE